jgi:5,10-methylenetetrahydromethanopterin reductase
MFTVGADVERLRWGIETAEAAARDVNRDLDDLAFGAYVNIVCHSNLETAHKLARGGATLFARFSVMHGGISGPVDAMQAEVLNSIHERYDMKGHGRGDSQQTSAVTPEFIDRFAIVGDPAQCVDRLQELKELGLDRLAVSGPTFSAQSEEGKEASELFETQVLPRFA